MDDGRWTIALTAGCWLSTGIMIGDFIDDPWSFLHITMAMRFPRGSILITLLVTLRTYSALECELYIAESTIPNAGIGIFSGVAKSVNDVIGNGDKAIPLVEVSWHNGYFENDEDSFDPMEDYVWGGEMIGMGTEAFDANDVTGFWPGIDAMVNCHFGLLNVASATPIYDEGGIHRDTHPGAGSVSPYGAGESLVEYDVPVGGEIFKDYGDHWFLSRPSIGQIPIGSSYYDVLDIMIHLDMLLDEDDEMDILVPAIYEELIKEFKTIWDSRTLNAIHDFSWDDITRAIDADDMGLLLQSNATRSIDWLNENGRCIDHIVYGQNSTINGAGSGAFAKRNLPEDTIITGTPLIVFPQTKWFEMHDLQTSPDGSIVQNKTSGPLRQQLLLNYCFGHSESTVILCPYGSGVNSINHNQTKANVRIQWAKNDTISHRDVYLKIRPKDMVHRTTKVAFDYVAIRDIAEGEELFLDYGNVWEEKWNGFVKDWQSRNRDDSFEQYISAADFNTRHEKAPLLTIEEQLLNPYPDNLSTRCHSLVEISNQAFLGDVSKLSNWYAWGGNLGYACDVLKRNPNNESYWVNIETSEKVWKQITNVPRQAIKFADNPYTTDLHMIGAFRQPIGIPDDILPHAWKRTDGDDEKQAGSSTYPTSRTRETHHTVPDNYYETYKESPNYGEMRKRKAGVRKIRGT